MTFAPEGRPFIFLAFALFAALAALAWWRSGLWMVLFVVWIPMAVWVPIFFRNPDRDGPRGPDLVIAPADGRVTDIVQLHEADFIGGPATRVSVFMNVFDVHVNRHPVSGIVRQRQYRPGKFLNATVEKASEDNERMSLGVETSRGPVLIRQIAGLVARRIVTDPVVGDTVRQGERLGLIRFGSRVDTFLPPGFVVRVARGDRTKAGITVLAEWPS